MTVAKFDYIEPESIEAITKILYQEGDNASAMAGGTDLLVKIRRNMLAPKLIVSLKKVPGLSDIRFNEKTGLTIGATALLSQVARNQDILEHYPTIATAAGATANTQIRNMGTVVGNICNASPSADNAPILLAMRTNLHVKGVNKNRVVPLEHFFLGPGITVLKRGEIVTSAFVPIPTYSAYGTSYHHVSQKGKIGCAAVGVGVMLTVKEDKFEDVRIFIGACAPTPIRSQKAEEVLNGAKIDQCEQLINQASVEASNETSPISDVRSSAEYRKEMVKVMSKRAIMEAKQMATATSNLVK